MTVTAYPGAPQDFEDEKQHRRLIAQAISRLFHGKSNNVLDVTLDANQATTAVIDSRIGVNTVPVCVPTTASAQAIAMPYRDYSTAVNGSMVLNHANDSSTDKTFKIILVG